MKKKLFVAAVIVAVLFLVAVLLFAARYRKMVRLIESVKIENVDLSQIGNGAYSGSFGDFLVHVDLDVTVKDHRIANIKITRQDAGPGHEARETVDRILKAQSPKVDAVTGATGSSKCIMIAAQKALLGR